MKLDTISHKSLFVEEGYITGLFKIFNNNSDFWLEINKKSKCIISNKEDIINYLYNPLLSLNEDTIKIDSLEKIFNFKFSFGIQEYKIDKLLISQKSNKIANYSDFLFFVLDLTNTEYYNNVDTIIKIFNNNINIKGVLYKVKSYIFHIDNNHFIIAIFNNDFNLFNLKQKINYYLDDLKNEGIIIDIKENFQI